MLKPMERTINISSGSIVKKGKEDLEGGCREIAIFPLFRTKKKNPSGIQ